jgi:hypothetical protein
MTWLLIVFNVVAAVLPMIGFGRLLYRTHRTVRRLEVLQVARGHKGNARSDLTVPDITTEVRQERGDLVWDIVLVGLGLALGAFANIWPLAQQFTQESSALGLLGA